MRLVTSPAETQYLLSSLLYKSVSKQQVVVPATGSFCNPENSNILDQKQFVNEQLSKSNSRKNIEQKGGRKFPTQGGGSVPVTSWGFLEK